LTYRQELAREQRIQDGIASRLKYSFNNNMSSIKIVYRYLHGSGQGFEKFWKKNGERVDYKCIANHKLYDEEMLLEAFRTDDSFRRFMDRNKITSWDILAYRADESKEASCKWSFPERPSLYYV